MANQDVKKAKQIKKLLDAQLKYVDQKSSPEEQQAEAEALLDKLLGTKDWRDLAEVPGGIMVVELSGKENPEVSEEADGNYEEDCLMRRIQAALAEEGKGADGIEMSHQPMRPEKKEVAPTGKDRIRAELHSLVDKLLDESEEE